MVKEEEGFPIYYSPGHMLPIKPMNGYSSPKVVHGRINAALFSGGRLAKIGRRPPRVRL
jgi:hypothetical protein